MSRAPRELFDDFTRAVAHLDALGDELSLEEAEGLRFQLEELVTRAERALELAHDRNTLTPKDLVVLESAGMVKCVAQNGDTREYALSSAMQFVLSPKRGKSL